MKGQEDEMKRGQDVGPRQHAGMKWELGEIKEAGITISKLKSH